MMTQSDAQKICDDVMDSLHSLQAQCNSPQNLFLLIVKHIFWCVMPDVIVLG